MRFIAQVRNIGAIGVFWLKEIEADTEAYAWGKLYEDYEVNWMLSEAEVRERIGVKTCGDKVEWAGYMALYLLLGVAGMLW